MILVIAVIVLIIEESLHYWLKLLFFGILLFATLPATVEEIAKFDNLYSFEDFDQGLERSAFLVNEMQNKDKYVFVDIWVDPAYIYKTHHNVFQLSDSTAIKHFMGYFNTDHVQYYHHENNQLKYMIELEKKEDSVQILKRVNFDN